MIDFLYFILSVWGLTHLLVSSKILADFRNWCLIKIPFIGEMLECYQCTSFWCSLLLFSYFPGLNFGTNSFIIGNSCFNLDFIMASFIGSGIVSFIAVIMSMLIHKSK